MTIKEKALSGLRWTGGMRFVSQLLTWAMTLVVIRVLSPADYGLLAMVSVIIAFVSRLSEIGLGPAIVQKADVAPDTLKKILGLVLTINLAISVLLSLAAPALAAFFHDERLVLLIRVMSLQFLGWAFMVIPDAVLQKQMEFRKRSLMDLGGSVVSGGTTLACALAGWGVWSLAAGTFVSLAWRVIGLNVIMGSWLSPSFSFSGLGQYALFGGYVSLSGLLWFVYTQADVFIGGRWLGKEALGYYTVAMHLGSLFNQRISGILNQVAFPAFSQIQNDLQQVGEKVLLGIRVLSFFAFPCLWGMSAVAPEIVLIILGEKWAPAILPLSILTLIMPLRLIGNFVPNALQGVGRADVGLKNAIWTCLLMISAFLVGVGWGLEGLSYSWLVGAPLAFLQETMRSMPALGLRKFDMVKSFLPSASASLVMYCAVAATRMLAGLDSANLSSMLILVFVGGATYACSALLLNRPGCDEVRHMLRQLTGFRAAS